MNDARLAVATLGLVAAFFLGFELRGCDDRHARTGEAGEQDSDTSSGVVVMDHSEAVESPVYGGEGR